MSVCGKISLGVTENVKQKSDKYTYHTYIPHNPKVYIVGSLKPEQYQIHWQLTRNQCVILSGHHKKGVTGSLLACFLVNVAKCSEKQLTCHRPRSQNKIKYLGTKHHEESVPIGSSSVWHIPRHKLKCGFFNTLTQSKYTNALWKIARYAYSSGSLFKETQSLVQTCLYRSPDLNGGQLHGSFVACWL